MENTIFKIGTYTSGIDAGEIGYSLRPYNLEKLNDEDLRSVITMTDDHALKFEEELKKRGHGTSLRYKLRKFIDIRYFPAFKKNYSMFPVRLGWVKGSSHAFIAAHGWQNGWTKGKRHYGWTLHMGSLKIKFGNSRKGE